MTITTTRGFTGVYDAEDHREMVLQLDRTPAMTAARAAVNALHRVQVLRTDREAIDLRVPVDSYDALLEALEREGLIVDGEEE